MVIKAMRISVFLFLVMVGMCGCNTVSWEAYYFSSKWDKRFFDVTDSRKPLLGGFYINKTVDDEIVMFCFFENDIFFGSTGLSSTFRDTLIFKGMRLNPKMFSKNDFHDKHNWGNYRISGDTLFMRGIDYNYTGGPLMLNKLPVVEYQGIIKGEYLTFFMSRTFSDHGIFGIRRPRGFVFQHPVGFSFFKTDSKPDSVDNFAFKNRDRAVTRRKY